MSRLLATLQDSLSKLTIDEWKPDVEAVASNDPSFKILDWAYKGVPPEALTALAGALETNSNLTTVLVHNFFQISYHFNFPLFLFTYLPFILFFYFLILFFNFFLVGKLVVNYS